MTIREFLTTLAPLAPLSVPQLMERYQLTEAQARDELRNSWQPALRVAPTAAVLDDPRPSPTQFAQVCDSVAFVIGNVSLAKELTDWGNGFWAMGSMEEDPLFINELDQQIYYAGHDAAVEYDYAGFRPCARDFGSLLAALLYYFRYVREFFVLDSDPQPLLLTREELLAATLRAAGREQAAPLFERLYG